VLPPANRISSQQFQNKSFVLNSVNNVAFEERPIPALQNPTDVLIEIKQTGICGSDVHYCTHGAIGSFILRAPMVLGHESAGIISQVGPAVKTLKVGDRVALEPGVPCRHCQRCKAGQYNLCVDMKFAATPPYDGTLCKYYVLPEDFCVKLPENVSLEEGALMEPLSVGVHIARQASIKPGESVVVFGAGPIGLLVGAVARAFGAGKIVIVDINEERLKFAEKFVQGAGIYIPQKGLSAAENAAALLKAHGLPETGVDVAVDASGATPSIQTSIFVLRTGGTYVQAGMGAPEIQFPIVEMCAKELTVKGSFRYAEGDYRLAVELVASGKVDVKQLITGRVKFEDAEEAFNAVKNGKGIKTLIAGPE
jgi:D-xylulose reductase